MTRSGYCTALRKAGLAVKPALQATSEGSSCIDLTAYRLTDRAGTYIGDLMLLDDGLRVRAFVETGLNPIDLAARLTVETLYRTLTEAGA